MALCENSVKTGGFHYLPETEEYGPLAKYAVGTRLHKVVRIMSCVYRSENGFAVYEADEDDRRFKITGVFPYPLAMNGYYQIAGSVAVNKRGWKQIKVSSCESTTPTDKKGIITVLKTLHGLDTQAHMLYEIAGNDILNLIMTDPEGLAARVKGIGVARAKMWQEDLLSRGENDRELRKLYDLGLSRQQAIKLVTESEDGIKICEEIRQNPYLLIGKIRGYSFKKCDELALNAGIGLRSTERIRQGILSVLKSIGERGHSTYPEAEFMAEVHKLLDVSISRKTAGQILKNQEPGATFQAKWGRKTYTVSVNDLKYDLEEWDRECHAPSEKYRYIVDYIEAETIEKNLLDVSGHGVLYRERYKGEAYITPACFYKAENAIASDIRDIAANERLPFSDLEPTIQEVLGSIGVTLEAMQMEAVRRICRGQGGAFILNGSAGCGKTFTLNIILKVLERLYKKETNTGVFNPIILAPTGKAARVAAKATGLEAQTIHRALGFVAAGNDLQVSAHSISNNCIIIDETSMMDEVLASNLLENIPKTSKLIFLGDTAQLPSIGAGKVLADLIASHIVPVITLNVIKRQDAQSGILVNANRIVHGEPISSVIRNEKSMDGNSYVIPRTNPIKAREEVLKIARQCGLAGFQKGEIQVLAPLRAGPAGVETLNYYIQKELNPCLHGEEIVTGSLKIQDPDGPEYEIKKSFRPGDFVIHTRNNYSQPWLKKQYSPAYGKNEFIETHGVGIINGDTGVIDTIASIRSDSGVTHKILYVQYDDHYIAYEEKALEDLSLAYAITIHKSQGSQASLIVAPITQKSIILNRKLMYTAITRAQNSCIIIGNNDCIQGAIRNDKESRRITMLVERLQQKSLETPA